MVYRYHFEAWPGTISDERNKLIEDISVRIEAEGVDTYTDFYAWVKLNYPDRFTPKEVQALYLATERYEYIQFIRDVSEKTKAAGVDNYTDFVAWVNLNLPEREFTPDEVQELYDEVGHFMCANWKVNRRNRVFGILIKVNLPRLVQRLLKSWDRKFAGSAILLLVCLAILAYPRARPAMLWAVITLLLLIPSWFLFCKWYWARAAEVDTKERLAVALEYVHAFPPPPEGAAEEVKEEYYEEVHWHVLNFLGLPPPSIVNYWLNSDKFFMLPKPQMILKYCKERMSYDRSTRLPSGRRELHAYNGNWKLICELLETDAVKAKNTWDRASIIFDKRRSRQ